MSDKGITDSTSRRLRVFLCYATGDKSLVRDLYARLRTDKIHPWLDEEELVPGQDWELEILRAVRAADIVVVCLSKGSVTKAGFVQKEIKLALDVADMQPEGTIFLVPVRLEECDVPERLQRWQWVNLFEEQGYARLLRAMSVRFGQIIGSSGLISRLEESNRTTHEGKIENLPDRVQPERYSETADLPLRTESEIHNNLLHRWNDGEGEARDELFIREYAQLKLIANMKIQTEWEIDGLQAEELLSELYIKLLNLGPTKWQNREHFLVEASRLMATVLVEWARRKYSRKRGPTRWEVEREAKEIVSFNKEELRNLQDALRLLEKIDSRKAQIVELRFFGGLTIEEVANSLDISATTVEREWKFARDWLARQLK